jgi:hypothetical protein
MPFQRLDPEELGLDRISEPQERHGIRRVTLSQTCSEVMGGCRVRRTSCDYTCMHAYVVRACGTCMRHVFAERAYGMCMRYVHAACPHQVYAVGVARAGLEMRTGHVT